MTFPGTCDQTTQTDTQTQEDITLVIVQPQPHGHDKHTRSRQARAPLPFMELPDPDPTTAQTQEDAQNEVIESVAVAPPRRRPSKRRASNEPDNPCFKYYDIDERRFYRRLSFKERQQVGQTEARMEEINNDVIPMRFKILLSGIDDTVKAIAMKKIEHLSKLDDSSSEYYKIMNWMTAVCKLPINKYKQLPVSFNSPTDAIKEFLLNVRERLNAIVYGHNEAKDQIVRLLAQWIANPESKGMVIGIQGPMGCGKTTLVKEGISNALGLPFAFVPLGGASDGSYLEGHGYTYEGATWGKIVDVLMKSGCMNPVFFFDELDKVSTTHKGEEIINILMHLTDSSQNDKISDRYFSDFEFDLSKSLIIFSYNDEDKICPILRDRMIKIYTKGYSNPEKTIIASKYMLPEIYKEYRFNESDISISEDVIRSIIELVEDEKGVRNLKRALQSIVSHINLKRFLDTCDVTPHVVTQEDAKSYVMNKKKFSTLPFMYT